MTANDPMAGARARSRPRRTLESEADAAHLKRERRIERAVESAVRRRADRESRRDGSDSVLVAHRIRTQRAEVERERQMEKEKKLQQLRRDRDVLRGEVRKKREENEARTSSRTLQQSRRSVSSASRSRRGTTTTSTGRAGGNRSSLTLGRDRDSHRDRDDMTTRSADEPALSSWVKSKQDKEKQQRRQRKKSKSRGRAKSASRSVGGSVGSISSALRRRRSRRERQSSRTREERGTGGHRRHDLSDDEGSVATCATEVSSKSVKSIKSVGSISRRAMRTLSRKKSRSASTERQRAELEAEAIPTPTPERERATAPPPTKSTQRRPQVKREITTEELYPSFYQQQDDRNSRPESRQQQMLSQMHASGALESALNLFGLSPPSHPHPPDVAAASSKSATFHRQTTATASPSTLEERVVQLKLDVAEAMAEEEEQKHRARQLSDRNDTVRRDLHDTQQRALAAQADVVRLNRELKRLRKLRARLGPQIQEQRVKVWKAKRDSPAPGMLQRHQSTVGKMLMDLEDEAV